MCGLQDIDEKLTNFYHTQKSIRVLGTGSALLPLYREVSLGVDVKSQLIIKYRNVSLFVTLLPVNDAAKEDQRQAGPSEDCVNFFLARLY